MKVKLRAYHVVMLGRYLEERAGGQHGLSQKMRGYGNSGRGLAGMVVLC